MAKSEAILFREFFKIPRVFRKYRFQKIHFCKALKTLPRRVKIPSQSFDYLLLASDNALRFSKPQPQARVVLRHLHGERILDYFRKRKIKGGSILYLRSALGSKLGRADIASSLRRMGFRVTVRCTYRTQILPLRTQLLLLLKRRPIAAFFVTSPSTVEAIFRSLRAAELKKLRVRWICMGPTTSRHLSELRNR